ncbi:hypothetical protein BDV35DRAFT_243871 [Aspergillus flavus]|uniref:Uncharacterized protein n=1 Tax=Aspergillus flavus TaxID=5059 RepID=A0A5N6GX25_ASPFL|nr:hypothetical protein BDV35DRAFT_243871 [Aspergillus flavus]
MRVASVADRSFIEVPLSGSPDSYIHALVYILLMPLYFYELGRLFAFVLFFIALSLCSFSLLPALPYHSKHMIHSPGIGMNYDVGALSMSPIEASRYQRPCISPCNHLTREVR